MVVPKAAWVLTAVALAAGMLPATAQRPRAWLGVSINPNPEGGVIIHDVESNGPADVAWLRAGDVIQGIIIGGKDDHPVRSIPDLTKIMLQLSAGDTVKVRIQRGTKQRTVQVTVRAETEAAPRTAN